MNNTLIQPADVETVSHLNGVRVAITHDKEQAQDQVDLFAALGATIYYYPCIQIIPYEDKELENAVREAAIGKYDWLVLNDADTAWVVGEAMRAAGIDPNQIPRRLKVATIGCMTEIYTKEFLGLDSSFAPEIYTPEYVAEALRLKPGDRVLLPQSSMTRASLAKCLRNTGAEVTAINAYRTVIGRGGDPVPELLWEGKIDVVTFTFPTAVRYFVKRLEYEGGSKAMLDDVCIACIGPLTAAAARDYGFHVTLVPEKHTIAGLVEAVNNYFRE
ncbi:MAG: uroporphyrinogen-III synthase [Caldilinea sp.]|nr:uroporphyrinogen-III synthase [Caldilinea sp.]MDW8440832.1 uroporphyrinogen-III synthase [Caldilineaceae bacterium]